MRRNGTCTHARPNWLDRCSEGPRTFFNSSSLYIVSVYRCTLSQSWDVVVKVCVLRGRDKSYMTDAKPGRWGQERQPARCPGHNSKGPEAIQGRQVRYEHAHPPPAKVTRRHRHLPSCQEHHTSAGRDHHTVHVFEGVYSLSSCKTVLRRFA